MTPQSALYSLVESRIRQFLNESPATPLTSPISYLMGIGGKRMRPILTLMSFEACGGNPEDAIDAALAIEVFHNFTLMHDDIMDQAPLRRGRQTVHHKWSTNTAILSGDAMLIQAYQLISSQTTRDPVRLIQTFNASAFGVCEGQQMDMDFERRDDVTVEEYIEMIRLKTAVLLGCALEVGGLLANASEDDLGHLRYFGESLGVSFQLRDDYLDAFGDPDKFGKQVGGDILSDKKTYLLIRAVEKANADHLATLAVHRGPDVSADQKVHAVRQVMKDLGVDKELLELSEKYYHDALNHLDALSLQDERVRPLRNLAAALLERES